MLRHRYIIYFLCRKRTPPPLNLYSQICIFTRAYSAQIICIYVHKILYTGCPRKTVVSFTFNHLRLAPKGLYMCTVQVYSTLTMANHLLTTNGREKMKIFLKNDFLEPPCTFLHRFTYKGLLGLATNKKVDEKYC